MAVILGEGRVSVADADGDPELRDLHRAMVLAREHGFHPIPDLCRGQVFVVGRSRPGECYEVISFRDGAAQAVRCQERRIILLGEDEAGTAKWTGPALRVVREVLGLREGEE